jgi:hypothetical protein
MKPGGLRKKHRAKVNIHIYHEGHEEREVKIIMFSCSPFIFLMIFMVNFKVFTRLSNLIIVMVLIMDIIAGENCRE